MPENLFQGRRVFGASSLGDARERRAGLVAGVGAKRRRRPENVECRTLAGSALGLGFEHTRQADETGERLRKLGHLAQTHEIAPRSRHAIVGMKPALEHPRMERGEIRGGEQQIVDRAHLPRLGQHAIGRRRTKDMPAVRTSYGCPLGTDLAVVQRKLGLATRATDDQRGSSSRP